VDVINVQRLISRMKFLPQPVLPSPMAKIWIVCVWMRKQPGLRHFLIIFSLIRFLSLLTKWPVFLQNTPGNRTCN